MLSNSPTLDEIMAAECAEIVPLWNEVILGIATGDNDFLKQVLGAHEDHVESREDWTDCEKTVRRKRVILQYLTYTGRL